MNISRSQAALLAIAALAVASPAHAQQKKGGKDDAPITRTPDNLRAHPEPWPRLDAGAIFCDSQEDLDRHLAVAEARLDGLTPPPEPAGCHPIRLQTSITVLNRASPGHTQVKLSHDPGSVGWTDVFLPDKSPVAQKATNAAAPGF
jgi:hypothetical protein